MASVSTILMIAAGGAAGAVARYLVNISPLAGAVGKFPAATFAVNVSGSFLLGFLLIVLTDKINVSEELRMGVIVGFLGAFTTFSTFEMEIYGLLKDREFGVSTLYVLLSIVAGFVALLAGILLARRM